MTRENNWWRSGDMARQTRSSVFGIVLATCSLLVVESALAGSAGKYGVSDPAADFAVDACQAEINALPQEVADANMRDSLPRVIQFSAEQLIGFLPQIDERVEMWKQRGQEQDLKVSRIGACVARAVIRYKSPGAKAPAPTTQASSASTSEPVKAGSTPQITDPHDYHPRDPVNRAGFEEISRVMDAPEATRPPPDKGEDAKHCLTVTKTATKHTDTVVANTCPYRVEVAWCTPTVDCRNDELGNMKTVGAKGGDSDTFKVTGTAGLAESIEIQIGACLGANTIRIFSNPPYAYTCSKEIK